MNSLSKNGCKKVKTLNSLTRSEITGDDHGEPLAHRYQKPIGSAIGYRTSSSHPSLSAMGAESSRWWYLHDKLGRARHGEARA